MNQIRDYFENFATLSEKDWQSFSSKLTRTELPKKHLVSKKGKIERYLSFVESGIVRYYIPCSDNDITFDFAFQNEFVSAYGSFILQKPAAYQIETLTKTVLWQLTYDDLQAIYKETEIGNLIGRTASENLFIRKSNREISLLTETAEQRYLNLFSQQQNILKQIPLKYIASYIGITPQALSRIRKRIS